MRLTAAVHPRGGQWKDRRGGQVWKAIAVTHHGEFGAIWVLVYTLSTYLLVLLVAYVAVSLGLS